MRRSKVPSFPFVSVSSLARVAGVLAVALAPCVVPKVVRAQQPLEEFIQSSEGAALDSREARASLRQARSQIDEARARWLPSFQATGTYTRNEPQVIINIPISPTESRQAIITRADQLEARFAITVPIIDVASWLLTTQSEALADGAEARADQTTQTVQSSVVQLWYQLVANHSLVTSAQRNFETAERNRLAAQARVEVGVAPQLELARAVSEVARAGQSLAEARLQVTLTERNLQNLSGLAPTVDAQALEDDLHEEPPMERFMRGSDDLPAMRAARADRRAAGLAQDASWLALLPTIAATGSERSTNAAGFGPGDTWALAFTASWSLDFLRPAQIHSRAAQSQVQLIRAERAQQQTETGIFEAWQRIGAARARGEAANVALEASRRASSDADARYESGAGTQLDQIQAQRDLFSAEVARIQAIADLGVARAILRIRSGLALGEEGS